MPHPFCKSFLKWPGGKYRALPHLLGLLPAGKRLVEPFVGSGTVFLNTSYAEYLLCDINSDVIGIFQQLCRRPAAFIADCRALFTPENNCAERYYALREALNNAATCQERAALFVYCNRHGYNGLVRYNKKGTYNVPFGRYKHPYFPEKELHAFSTKCAHCGVSLAVQDFSRTFAAARAGDVIYCDPPYVPLSPTANFTAYAGASFAWEDQRRLVQLAQEATLRGSAVVLSNHDTAATRQLYSAAEVHSFPVRRSISCAARGNAAELLALFVETPYPAPTRCG